MRWAWLKVFVVTFILFLLGIIVLVSTNNLIIFPTVSMLGSFMVPVAFIAFVYEHKGNSQLKMPILVQSFIFGGILGVFASGFLEPLFVSKLDPLTAFIVGLIEEFAKILALIIIVFRKEHNSATDGIILGAAVGMGFAAFESTGYAFAALLESEGNFSFAVYIIFFRSLLSPIGHGLWTAILAGVLFHESKNNKFNFNERVFNAFLGVALLHGLWDGLPTFLSNFVLPGIDYLLAEASVATVGIITLIRFWRLFKQERSHAML